MMNVMWTALAAGCGDLTWAYAIWNCSGKPSTEALRSGACLFSTMKARRAKKSFCVSCICSVILGLIFECFDSKIIPESLHGMVFEHVIFDEEVSYELRPDTWFNYNRFRPIIFRTSPVSAPLRVKDMKVRFEQLWAK
jgi:hypothetical protein